MSARAFHGRTRARSQALQLLFQAEATDRSIDEVLSGDYALSDGPLDEFGERLARGAYGMQRDLDGLIDETSTRWSVSRLVSVDRNILRLALYEMLEVDDVAIAVTIDESVELAKAYGTDESSRFINGVLGKIARRLEAGEDVLATLHGQSSSNSNAYETHDELTATHVQPGDPDSNAAETVAADDGEVLS